MKYYVANFKIEGAEDIDMCRDIIASLAAEAGFESFEENGDTLDGYVRGTVGRAVAQVAA